MVLALVQGFPATMQAAQPQDDNTSPYFESAAVRDSFANCSKPIWTNNWAYLPDDKEKDGYVKFDNDSKYGNMTFRRLRNRRALTGEECTVNKLIGVVGVGSWAKDLGALTDEDLDNYAQVNAVVKAGVTVDPMVSVKDMQNYYTKGTVAGYAIVAGSGSSVLSLDVIKAFSIGFYRDGKLQGVVPVREGQNGSGVTLKLLQIPGSDKICAMLTAESDWLFDEISLDCSGGIQADVANLMKIKYAFVGEPTEFTITDGGIKKFNDFFDNKPTISLKKMQGWNPVLLGIPFPFVNAEVRKMTDDNLDNFATITPILNVGYQGGAKFMMKNDTNPNAEVFEAGMEAGFKYKMDAVLSLTAGTWINVLLFDRNGKKVQEETISAQVLNLSLVQIGDGTVSVKAKVPFSGCEIRFLTVLGVNVGGMGIHYGFVRMSPDVSHRCAIKPTISSNICDSQTSFVLRSNPKVSVTWALSGAWDLEGNDIMATTPVRVTPDGHVTHMQVGRYTFRATAKDGCYDETTITVGDMGKSGNMCGSPVTNKDGDIYELSPKIHGTSGSLLSISKLRNSENILKGDYNQYAEYIGGLKLADNLCVVGIHRKDGKLMYDADPKIKDGEKEEDRDMRVQPKRIGFVVEASATVLNLHALQFLQIRCYHDGKEVYRHLIDENNAISAGVGGSDKLQKIRYSIEVPATSKDSAMQMDEFQLWNSGVLDLGGSNLRIYYAFIEEAASDCSSPLACDALVMSQKKSHTTINADETKFGGTVNVLTIDDNLCNFIDSDLDTYMAIANTVGVGSGHTIAVNMGRILDYHHQLGIVVDNKTFLAAVKVGNWLTVETFKDGEPTGDKFTDWKVIGADVAGFGDKNILFFQPKNAYNEVRLTLASIVGALDVQKFYGIVTRGDINNNGIPDCKDDCSCVPGVKDIDVNNVCVGDIVKVVATGNTGAKYYLRFGDKSAGTNGIVELVASSETKNNIQYEYTTKKAGEFQLTFFDGSGTPLSSVVYQVHPLQTRWLTTASNNDWNKWDNWSNGSPYCCTDAIISSDAKIFPVLGTVEHPADYCCKDIFFEPRSAVENITSLNYRKAWVEMELKPNMYYNLSTPLKQTYTGDMFVPKNITAALFEPLTEDNCAESRFNPSIYQRLWATTAPGKIVSKNGKGGITLGDNTLGVLETQWSRHFNAVTKPYAKCEGFSLWVDNGQLPATNTFRIRLPKTHTKYSYYANYDEEILGNENLTRADNEMNRFVYEGNDPGNMTMTYVYKVGDKDVTEDRTVFVGQDSYQITLKADEPTKTFLLGNPFMSHIDIQKFLKANDNVGSVIVQTPQGEQTIAKAGESVVATDDATSIEPMQSFKVVSNADPSTSLTIFLTTEMIGGTKKPDAEGENKGETTRALRVNVESLTNGSRSASLLMMADDDVAAVPTLMDNEVKPDVKVFGISKSNAYDIMPMAESTSLGIFLNHKDSISIEVVPTEGTDAEEYVLHDNLTDIDYEIGSQVVVSDAETSLGRFVIRKLNGTDDEKKGNEHNVCIMQEGSYAVVQSAIENLKSVEVRDASGSLISKVQGDGSQRLMTKIMSGVQIVSIELTDGGRASYKMMFNEQNMQHIR